MLKLGYLEITDPLSFSREVHWGPLWHIILLVIIRFTLYLITNKFIVNIIIILIGSNKKTRNLLPNGFYKFVVHNVKELEMLLMHNKSYAAEVAHNVSSRVRKEIVERANDLNIKVLNANAKLNKEEAN